MGESVKHFPFWAASFRATLIGASPSESEDLEDALRRVRGSLTFGMNHASSAASSVYPAEVIHAIVFTRASLARVMPSDVAAVRSATMPGTCRVYLLATSRKLPPRGTSPLDDFIQRTPSHSSDAVAQEIIAFFREADDLNRRNTLFGLRDLTCLGAYGVLKILWPISYLFAMLHVINVAAFLAGRGPWPGLMANPYVAPISSFFGAFFIVHCIFVVLRNALFDLRIAKRFPLVLALGTGAFGLSGAATAYSMAAMDGSMSRILLSAVCAVVAYTFYMYARRVRAECTSLSELQTAMADDHRRIEVLKAVGRKPIGSAAFPFLPFRSKSLFISYMHSSEWSSKTASLIYRRAARHGFHVWMDQSSIPSGSLWRQFLLRGLSECGFFIAVLDGEAGATEWVLAESAYAALLRKSIGKPRIILIVRNETGLAGLQHGPFGLLYQDVFQARPESCLGAAIMITDHTELSDEVILRTIKQVRPMCLLW